MPCWIAHKPPYAYYNQHVLNFKQLIKNHIPTLLFVYQMKFKTRLLVRPRVVAYFHDVILINPAL